MPTRFNPTPEQLRNMTRTNLLIREALKGLEYTPEALRDVWKAGDKANAAGQPEAEVIAAMRAAALAWR